MQWAAVLHVAALPPPPMSACQVAKVGNGKKGAAVAKAQKLIVPSHTLPAIVSAYGLRALALLKIDCEGCEWEVIPSLDQLNGSLKVCSPVP